MHLTDEQLNEYLDHETDQQAVITLHLASCDSCAGRLAALQALFAEIESLPELELTQSIAGRIVLDPEPARHLPLWLTAASALQAFLALVLILLAAPFLSSLFPVIEIPSLPDTWSQLHARLVVWFDLIASFPVPSIPKLPMPELPNLLLILTLTGISLLWVMGNGLLLRKPGK